MKAYKERWPELQEFINDVDERINKSVRPADEVILDESEFQQLLKISKRQSSYLRSQRRIPYYKDSGKIYYILSDILTYIKSSRVSAVWEHRKF